MSNRKKLFCEIVYTHLKTKQEVRMKGEIEEIKWRQFKKNIQQNFIDILNQRIGLRC